MLGPVANADVEVSGTSGVLGSGTTGADGSFSLETLPPGTYVIEAWHEKYGTMTREVTVGESEHVEVDFTFSEPSA